MERELEDAILSQQKLDKVLNELANGQFARAIQIVVSLDRFDEARFRHWLRCATDYTNPMSKADAEALGRLSSERKWQGVASDLLGMLRRGRNDVRPALRIATSLVGIINRVFYGISDVTSEEKWDALANLAAELYPTGPDQDGLWDRSGGHNADLDLAGNGRLRWREALARTRRGGGAQLKNLLREMQNDYPENEELRHIAADRELSPGR